jgi:hypothetical protein
MAMSEGPCFVSEVSEELQDHTRWVTGNGRAEEPMPKSLRVSGMVCSWGMGISGTELGI